MLKTIGCCHIAVTGRHVENLSYSLHDARLLATLQQAGLGGKLYAGRPQGKIKELARQLVRMRTDALVLSVSEESLSTALTLCYFFAELRPDVPIYLWGRGARSDAVPHTTVNPLHCIDTDDVLLVVQRLLNDAGMTAVSQCASPYLSGLCGINDVERLGFFASDWLTLQPELEWFSRQSDTTALQPKLDLSTLRGAELSALLQALASQNALSHYQLQLPATAAAQLLAQLQQLSGLTALWLTQPDQAAITELQPLQQQGVLLHQISTGQLQQYGDNGLVALYSGYYPVQAQLPVMYHLELADTLPSQQKQHIYRWAAGDMALRSAAVLNPVRDLDEQKLASLKGPVSQETQGWPKHTYAISLPDSGVGQVVFDGEPTESTQVRYLSFSDKARRNHQAQTRTFLSLSSEADLIDFRQVLQRLHQQGELLLDLPEHKVTLCNSCRWSRYGYCNVGALPRLSVTTEQKVLTCRDSEPVGAVGEPYDDLLLKVKQQQQLKAIERGCASCEVRDDCSQCSQLPAALDGQYCQLRKAYPKAYLLFELKILPQLLQSVMPLGQEPLLLKLSYDGLPNQYYQGPHGPARTGNRPVLFQVLGQHFAWWRGSRKLLRLSLPLAVITEAWWLGAQSDDLTAFLSSAFKVDSDSAQQSLQQAMQKLATEEVVNGYY